MFCGNPSALPYEFCNKSVIGGDEGAPVRGAATHKTTANTHGAVDSALQSVGIGQDHRVYTYRTFGCGLGDGHKPDTLRLHTGALALEF